MTRDPQRSAQDVQVWLSTPYENVHVLLKPQQTQSGFECIVCCAKAPTLSVSIAGRAFVAIDEGQALRLYRAF